jgi:hypothetical protein
VDEKMTTKEGAGAEYLTKKLLCRKILPSALKTENSLLSAMSAYPISYAAAGSAAAPMKDS